MTNFFTVDIETDWDGRIYMRSVPGLLDVLELTRPLPCGNGLIPIGFRWDGASSGLMRRLPIVNFPKWRHPIATCRHDWRCGHAKARSQRKKADKFFRADVGNGGTWWEQTKGYIGVRLGALFGVGS